MLTTALNPETSPPAAFIAGKKEPVRLYINDREIIAEKDTNILEAARSVGIKIPSLCYIKDINQVGTCRVCLVEVDTGGRRSLQASCVYPVSEGLKVYTDSPRARRARKRVVELMLSDHDMQCLTCVRNLNCELQKLADEMGIRKIRVSGEQRRYPIQNKNPFIVRDYNKCVKCRRCEAVCREVQGVNVYSAKNRGFETVIAPAFMKDLGKVDCISCGQCVMNCPTGSLSEREYIDDVWRAIEDPEKYVVVQTAPAIQVTLGEAFGLPQGTRVTGKIPAALRRLGFDQVFSTEFAADLTIVEEGHELLERIEKGGKLPLISSCSPGWVKYCEHFYPEFIENLSTCKSPMEMFGALVKNFFSKKININPEKMVVVAVMPCTAKKFEAARPEMITPGGRDVDYVLTTREMARMIRSAGIRFDELPDEDYDQPLGFATGAGAIFAATGGVTEAVIRTALALTGSDDPDGRLEFKEVRGLRGIKEATVNIKDKQLKLAVAHGTRNAKRLLEKIKGRAKYHFIEIMACPGGCVGGGGQPITGKKKPENVNREPAKIRAKSLYQIDINKKLRKSHENPAIIQLYKEYLGHPLSPKAKELLHTRYTPRGKVQGKWLH